MIDALLTRETESLDRGIVVKVDRVEDRGTTERPQRKGPDMIVRPHSTRLIAATHRREARQIAREDRRRTQRRADDKLLAAILKVFS